MTSTSNVSAWLDSCISFAEISDINSFFDYFSKTSPAVKLFADKVKINTADDKHRHQFVNVMVTTFMDIFNRRMSTEEIKTCANLISKKFPGETTVNIKYFVL